MYNKFYGFSEKPFEITPDPKFLYLTSSHRKALDAMMKCIKGRQGFMSLTGEVGTGKTTLIHTLLMNLDHKVKTAFIFNTLITFEELLRIILSELYVEIIEKKDKQTLLYYLDEYLSHLGSDETVAVIIDEAQLLSKEILLQLGILFNLCTRSPGRLQIIFVGQPEFENMLTSSSLKIISQRVVIRHNITNLTEEESRNYIDHRLQLVGSSASEIFTPKAISVITNYAKGIPRIINIVCDNALLNGCSESRKMMDEKIVDEVIRNLDGPASRKLTPTRFFRFMKKPHPLRGEGYPFQRRFFFPLLFLLGLGSLASLIYASLLHWPVNKQNTAFPSSSQFHAMPAVIKTPQTTPAESSKIDNQNISAGTGFMPVKSSPAVVSSSAALMSLDTKTTSTKTIMVKKGQSISRIAQQYYGKSNITIVDLILNFNPEITNANLILIDQKIIMPRITDGCLILEFSDRTYKINVGTFRSPEFAGLYSNEPSLRGKAIEIAARKATPDETWYRIVVGKFQNEDEVLKIISILKNKNLLPLFGASPQLK